MAWDETKFKEREDWTSFQLPPFKGPMKVILHLQQCFCLEISEVTVTSEVERDRSTGEFACRARMKGNEWFSPQSNQGKKI